MVLLFENLFKVVDYVDALLGLLIVLILQRVLFDAVHERNHAHRDILQSKSAVVHVCTGCCEVGIKSLAYFIESFDGVSLDLILVL